MSEAHFYLLAIKRLFNKLTTTKKKATHFFLDLDMVCFFEVSTIKCIQLEKCMYAGACHHQVSVNLILFFTKPQFKLICGFSNHTLN